MTRRRPALAGALAGVLLTLAACGGGGDDAPRSLQASLDAARAAGEPFPRLTETTITVGDDDLSVVLADDPPERTQGLRERDSLGGYQGMLFVFDDDTSTPFTMSTVPVDLDIGFYDASGRRIARLLMKACAGSEAGCPLYSSGKTFRYALETLAGDLPPGNLR